MSIKRFELVQNGGCPGYSDPFGEVIGKNEGDYVLYTDHAAEVSRLEAEVMEQCRLNAMGAEREAKLRAERDSLRAQLEAAVCKCCDRPLTDDELKDAAGLSGEAQLTAQPDGVRDTAMRLEGARIVLKDCGWSNTGYASIILEEIAALSTTPGASENLLRERGSRKCAVCGADWQHHVYQQTKEDYPHEFEQALTTPAASTPPEGKVQRLLDAGDWMASRCTDPQAVDAWHQGVQALAAPVPQVRVYQDTEDAYKDTAPAPAPLLRCGVCGEYHDEGGINPCKACRAKEAPAPAPCGACDIEWLCGIPSADPHTCEIAPAPAPVCVCGHSKADHAEKHGWECSEECTCLKYTPAPACKTCDYLDFNGNHPADCPDCNAGEREK